MTADDWARRFASGEPVAQAVAVVVAHPDDETLWAGPLLGRLSDATLVMATDGAPEDMADARRLGFAAREDYAHARRGELAAALAALGSRARLIPCEIADQGVVHAVGGLAEWLAADLAGAAVVVTHPYEGGHPDHDAVALAARLAADRLGVPIVEFACYARLNGLREFARFVPHADAPEHVRPLTDADRARVEAALAAHASQASVFGGWRPDAERWRAAPAYDFARPPPGEAVLYDGFGWAMTSMRWREAVRAVLEPAA